MQMLMKNQTFRIGCGILSWNEENFPGVILLIVPYMSYQAIVPRFSEDKVR